MKQKIVLSPNTFLWKKGIDGLLYNVETGAYLRFKSSHHAIETFCKSVDNLANLYTVEIDDSVNEEEYENFLSSICNLKLGVKLPINAKFVSLPPKPFVINNVERIKEAGTRQYELLNNLSLLTFYLGGKTVQNKWFIQAIYPINVTEKLDISSILPIIKQAKGNRYVKYQFVVSEEINEKLFDALTNIKCNIVTFIFNIESFLANENKINTIKNAGFYIKLSLSPNDIRKFADDKVSCNIYKQPHSLSFLVDGESCLRKAENIASRLRPQSSSYLPVWNDNYDFFCKHVLLTEEDLLRTKITKRHVHIHELVNLNFWGQLVIMPDGKVYSDVNSYMLGDTSMALSDLIAKEIMTNNAWRRIRDYGKCASCVYQWLCPSPSTFEKLSGKTICVNI